MLQKEFSTPGSFSKDNIQVPAPKPTGMRTMPVYNRPRRKDERPFQGEKKQVTEEDIMGATPRQYQKMYKQAQRGEIL